MALHFRLAEHGRAFATRERGEELRDQLARLRAGTDPVIIDLDGVGHVSYSFADEFLGKLFADGAMSIRLTNANASVARIAQRAIAGRTGEAMPC